MENCKNHDHNSKGKCLVINWKGALEEKQEALAHKFMDEKEEQQYIYQVNQENRQKVMENNIAPF